MKRASVRATWSNVLWSSLRTITRQAPPRRQPGPADARELDRLRHRAEASAPRLGPLAPVAVEPAVDVLGRHGRTYASATLGGGRRGDPPAHPRLEGRGVDSRGPRPPSRRGGAPTASSCAPTSSNVPKCVTHEALRASQPRSTSSDACHASTSMSGGGVGAQRPAPAAIRTPATSPTYARAVVLVQVGDVVGGVARACRRRGTAARSQRPAAAQHAHVAPPAPARPRPTGAPCRRRRAAARWRQAASRVDQVRRAALVDVDLQCRASAARARPSRPAWSRWMWVSSSARGDLAVERVQQRRGRLDSGPGSTSTSPTCQQQITRSRPEVVDVDARACSGIPAAYLTIRARHEHRPSTACPSATGRG